MYHDFKNILNTIACTLFVFGCLTKKTTSKFINLKEPFIISVQDVYSHSQIDKETLYCLAYLDKEQLYKLLNNAYDTRYSLYDTLFNLGANCVVDNWPQYWTNSCSLNKLNISSSSSEDLINNSRIIQKLHDTTNYSYRHLNIVNKKKILQIGLYVGIAKVNSVEYCKVFQRGFSAIPSDSMVIFRKDFKLIKE